MLNQLCVCWIILAPMQTLVFPGCEGIAPVAPMLFALQLTPAYLATGYGFHINHNSVMD
jgi:hypothetical protein